MEPVLGFDLRIPAKGARSLLRDLHAQLRAHIISGRLQPGVLLPSSRALAQALGIGRNTAVALYDLLMSEGYVASRPGGGTYVAEVTVRTERGEATRPRIGKPAADSRIVSLWQQQTSGSYQTLPAVRYDFSVGVPGDALFPLEIWRRLSSRALRRLTGSRCGYGEPQGVADLRAAICGHISFARAVSAEAEDVVVCAGAQQAFSLAAKILVTPGRTVVAMEDPGYAPVRRAFELAGALVTPVPVDAEGIIVDRIPSHARVVCVTPSHQFPLGVPMSLPRRRDLLTWARANGASIIEDDYDSEFRYGPRPLDALKTIDTDENVFYVGTFSKTMFPALRLGYAVVPAWALAAFTAAKEVSDWQCGIAEQLALAEFIGEGHLARHVRKARTIYAQRRELLVAGIGEHLGGFATLYPSEAGLHVACAAPRKVADEVAARAEGRGLRVRTFRGRLRTASPSGILLGFGRIERKDVGPGLRRMAELFSAAAGADRT